MAYMTHLSFTELVTNLRPRPGMHRYHPVRTSLMTSPSLLRSIKYRFQLRILKTSTYQRKPKPYSNGTSVSVIVRFRQGNQSVNNYIRTFRQEHETLKEHRGSLNGGKGIEKLIEERFVENILDNNIFGALKLSKEEKEARKDIIRKQVEEEIEALAILKWTDKKRYGNLHANLQNQ